MKVAVYTIALNEEHFVERWANSAKDADYLLIADTGSVDSTIDTAKKMGINVQQIFISPWRFDNARNTVLALLPPDIDYCIALDMDEILLPGWREQLEIAHKQGITRPRYQYTWSWKDKEETIPDLQYGGDKIHKRTGYRWKHPVHEVIVNDRIQEIQGWIDLQIHHHPDHSKPRSQYMPLLELSVKEDPMDDRNAHYYARELFFQGMFDKAKKEFLRHLSLPTATWKPERAASMRYIAKCSIGQEREQWFKKATEEAPDRREAMTDLAEYYYHEKRWKECLDTVEKILAITEKPLEYLCEEKAWGSFVYDIGSLAAYNLEKYKIAFSWGVEAVKKSPQDNRLRNNILFFHKSLNQ
jgi:glycosyltransferase involved in cell wall biosynthesis